MITKKALAIVHSRLGCPKEDDWELMEAANHLASVVEKVKEYCDAGFPFVSQLIEDFKHENVTS